MKTAVKVIAGLVSVVLLMIAAAAIFLATMVHSHWLKNQISEYAKSATGRDLIIKGNLHASFWPRLGITVDDVSLSDPEGFSGRTFLKAHQLTIDAELMPLLHRQLIVNHASLRDAEINLEKNAAGNSNWEFKSSASTAAEKKSSSENAEQAEMKFNIDSLSLIRTTINYSDARTHKEYSFADVNLTAKGVEIGKPFPIQGQFTLVSADNKKTGIKINTVLAYEESANKITLNNMVLALKLNAYPEINILGNLRYNMANASLNIDDLALKMGTLKLSGDLAGKNLLEEPSLKGHLSSNTFNLKKILSSNSFALNLKDKNALTEVQFDSNLQVSADKIKLDDLKANVDGQALHGWLEYTLSPAAHIGFTLNANEFKLENYLPSSGGKSESSKKSSADESSKRSNLVVDGSVNLEHFTYSGYRLSDLKTSLRYASKQLDLQNFSAGIFGGRTNGTIHVNFNSNSTAFTIDQRLSGVRANELLNSLVGSAKLSGNTSATISLSASGSGQSLKRSLRGNINFNVSNGAIIGTDIDYQVDQAIAKYTQRSATLSNTGQTQFSHLSGSANISNGITNTPNLELLTPTLRVQSAGSLNMLSNSLDYKLTCRLLKPQKINTEYLGTKINADLSNYDIPAKVGCTLQSPCVSVDISGVLKIVATEGAKAAAKTVIEKHLLKNVNPEVGKVLDQFFQKQ